jgi:hypothetical protein
MNSQDIVKNSGDITLVNPAVLKGEFCKLWPDVKTGLNLLQSIIKNPIAKGAIGLVIAAGDAVSKQVCG